MQGSPIESKVSGTHRRLLDAATRVFAQSGLEGATTREIAREAGVNEVTLFRHFQSKEKLLSAVLRSSFNPRDKPASPAGTTASEANDFRTGLRQYIRDYQELLQRNMPLVRTVIGEIHRHRRHEKQVLKGIFMPLKEDLIALIRAARTRGAVRVEIDPLIAADLLGGLIFMEVLRRTSPFAPEYSSEVYFENALDVFVRGLEPTHL